MNTFREILVERIRDMDSLISQIEAGKIAVALSWAEGVKTATEQALRELDKLAGEA